ncbi:MAG: phage gp6-like head-tail connector protein [Selenomonadaceae bacterium]|nr:phage gp6-like head-tail connector protein [Selenomonadaceae bacterium]MBQ7628997.1 phage gp6-like head-tail connector protein [Selenomonadaceae bacterium]
MLTLEKAKNFLRIDTDDEDALIQSLIDSAVAYIEDTTGMTAENQTSPLVETLQAFLVANWYENRADGGNMAGSTAILSLLKTVKSKAATT